MLSYVSAALVATLPSNTQRQVGRDRVKAADPKPQDLVLMKGGGVSWWLLIAAQMSCACSKITLCLDIYGMGYLCFLFTVKDIAISRAKNLFLYRALGKQKMRAQA